MKRMFLATVALAILVSLEASAWGGFGHRTIAELAERHLTPAAKANIERYTKGTPLADYSVWMDQIRKDDPVLSKATDGWHASIVDAKCHTSQEIRDRHRNGRDAVTGMLLLTDMLKEREKLSDSTVMFAIKCIVHMVGDIHCPAHVRYMGKKTTLHKVWDTSVITRDHKGWTPKYYAKMLDTYKPGKIKKITRGWAEEWLEDAARNVRPSLEWAGKDSDLGIEFQNKAYPLAEIQLRNAGYRLAYMLNTLFR